MLGTIKPLQMWHIPLPCGTNWVHSKRQVQYELFYFCAIKHYMKCQRSQGLESEGHTSQRTTWTMYIVVNSKELNIPFLPPYLFFLPKFQPHCASFIRMPSLPSSSHKRNYLAQVSITAFSFMLKRTVHLGLCLCKFLSSTMRFLTWLLLLEGTWHHHNLLCWCSGHIVAFLVTRNIFLYQQSPDFGRVGDASSFHPSPLY